MDGGQGYSVLPACLLLRLLAKLLATRWLIGWTAGCRRQQHMPCGIPSILIVAAAGLELNNAFLLG